MLALATHQNGQLEIRQQMIDESKKVAREFAIRRFQNVAKVFVLLQDPQQLSNLFQKSYLEVVDETTNSTIAKFVAPNMPLEQARCARLDFCFSRLYHLTRHWSLVRLCLTCCPTRRPRSPAAI